MLNIFLKLALLMGTAHADVTFEGYYRIEDKGEHVGFSIVREEYDSNAKVWTLRYFIHTLDRDQQPHHIEAVSKHDQNFHLLESDYREIEGEEAESSHTQIQANAMAYQANIEEQANHKDFKGTLFEDEFLRPVTTRVLMLNQIEKGKVYSFKALVDNQSVHRTGQIRVLDRGTFGEHKLFQIVDTFELHLQELWVLDNGQILYTRLPDVGVTSQLVGNLKTAVGNISFDRGLITKFFGKLQDVKRKSVLTKAQISSKRIFKANFDMGWDDSPNAIPLTLAH